jgi:hypothetical protein
MDDVVTKTAFASICGVSNARVSQWLADGKLDGEAVVGHGHRARIRVDGHFRRRISPGASAIREQKQWGSMPRRSGS